MARKREKTRSTFPEMVFRTKTEAAKKSNNEIKKAIESRLYPKENDLNATANLFLDHGKRDAGKTFGAMT